jgi:hypothetical protein
LILSFTMISSEENRLSTITKPVQRRIEVHLRWLRKELERTTDELVGESRPAQERTRLVANSLANLDR